MNKVVLNIIEEIKKGNPLAFKEVYRLYYAQLCRFASDFIDDADEVEDLVQDTLIKIWDKRDELAITNLKNYLFTSVRNACINRLEHIKIVQNHKEKNISEIKLLELQYDLSDDDFDDDSLGRKVITALDSLPEQCGKIVRMKYIDGLKAKEIAEITNLSVRTVETQIYKGIKTLTKYFETLLPILIVIIILMKQLYVYLFPITV